MISPSDLAISMHPEQCSCSSISVLFSKQTWLNDLLFKYLQETFTKLIKSDDLFRQSDEKKMKFFSQTKFHRFLENFNLQWYTTVWYMEFQKFSPTRKIFRQIDLQYNSLVKTLIWRNFCKKMWRKNYQITTPQCGISQIFVSRFFCKNLEKIPWNQRSKGVI